MVIAVSHEGGTRITNEAVRAAGRGSDDGARHRGRSIAGAELADHVIATEEQDQSWCHTVGYLSPLVVGACSPRASRDLASTRPPSAHCSTSRTIRMPPRAWPPPWLASIAHRGGIGSDYVTARELALKLAEGARLPPDAHDLETVLHGHLAAATRWTGLLVVMTDAGTGDARARASLRVLEAARALGVPAAAIIADQLPRTSDSSTPAGRIVLPHTGRVGGVAGSLLAPAMALQLLTERLARARGVNPDTLGREDPAQAAAHA